MGAASEEEALLQQRETRRRRNQESESPPLPLSPHHSSTAHHSHHRRTTSIFVFIGCFFVTVATILGTGILGLPVKSGPSGFTPFVSTFSVCLVMQILVACFMVELLQKTAVLEEHNEIMAGLASDPAFEAYDEGNGAVDQKLVPGEEEEHTGEDEWSHASDGQARRLARTTVAAAHVSSVQKKMLSKGPDLHSMGNLFLNKPGRVIFDISVILHFISILISYNLAGSKAYGELFGISQNYLIGPFWFVMVLLIVFGASFMAATISIGTLVKGSLLIVMVAVVGYVGTLVSLTIQTHWWPEIGESFLLGTVALGGGINIFPVIFSKIQRTHADVQKFRIAVCLAIFFCWLLNVLWCLFILEIVPQFGTGNDENGNPVISLEQAAKNGDISTVPLSKVIDRDYKQYHWVSALVNVFIIISITISFIAMGTGLKHMLDGFVKKRMEQAALDRNSEKEALYPSAAVTCCQRTGRWCGSFWGFFRKVFAGTSMRYQFSLYVLFFGMVVLVASLNPKGFLVVLEVFTSLALNVESGLFVALMVYLSRKPQYDTVPIPLRMSQELWWTWWLVMAYFLFACLYDIVVSLMKAINGTLV